MDLHESYIADMVVRMAHHSTAIEGNTLTQGETKSILLDNYIPRHMDLREFYEVANYRDYMDYLLDHKDESITIDHIKDTHRLLMNHIIDDNGRFKVIPNLVQGAEFEPTPPYMVQEALKNWTDTLDYRLQIAKNQNEKIQAIMESHLQFELIHPFSDGNGRTGRALIVHSCLAHDIPPIIISKSIKNEYINYLNTKDTVALTTMGKSLAKEETHRIDIFSKSSVLHIQKQSKGQSL